MKITAEFNSNEELLSFISTFGTRNLAEGQALNLVAKEPVANKVETKKEAKKEEAPKVDAEVVGVDVKTTEVKDAEVVKEDPPKEEDTKITKEMVRAVFSKLIKAGKQKEAKEITEKYGAKKLPDLAEEHYEAAYKDAEGLL